MCRRRDKVEAEDLGGPLFWGFCAVCVAKWCDGVIAGVGLVEEGARGGESIGDG